MKPYYRRRNTTLYHSGALEAMRLMPENSVDSLVTDPPAGINFMGAKFDSTRGGREQWIAWLAEIMAEALRILKPGGHGLVWSIPRTSHWTGMALEDAGWEIANRISHIFGSGWGKGLDVSKSIDKLEGAEREVIGPSRYDARGSNADLGIINDDGWKSKPRLDTAPATEAAKQWEGWNSQLKPAVEDWWLIKKPLSESSIARQVLATGTGVLNVGASRVRHRDSNDLAESEGKNQHAHYKNPNSNRDSYSGSMPSRTDYQGTAGRYPSHLLLSHVSPDENGEGGCVRIGERRVKSQSGANERGLQHSGRHGGLGNLGPNLKEGTGGNRGYKDPDGMETVEDWQCAESCPIAELDRQSGVTKSTGGNSGVRGNKVYGEYGESQKGVDPGFGDRGGASRYFVNFEPDTGPGFIYQSKASRRDKSSGGVVKNTHKTVKSTALMRYLVRMITPPGGTVLDCFMGSGSTGVAAVELGFGFIGIEKDEEEEGYMEISRARLHATNDEAAGVGTLFEELE